MLVYRIRRKSDGLYLSNMLSHWSRGRTRVKTSGSKKRVMRKRVVKHRPTKRKQKRRNARLTPRQIARAEARRLVRKKVRKKTVCSVAKWAMRVDLRWGLRGRTWRDLKALGRAYKRCLANTSEEMEIVESVLQETAVLKGILLNGRVEFLKQ